MGWTHARAFGDVWLGWQLWRKLGLEKIMARHIKIGRETVSPATMVAIEVISRLCIGQGGELCMRDWHHVRRHVEVKSVQRDGAYLLLSDRTD